MLWGGLLALGLLGFVALPDALLRRLERTWPQPSAQVMQQQVGVIVLGGALDDASYWAAHGQVPLNDAAERMTVPLGWLRSHPQWQLVFTGGSGRLVQVAATEADLARQFYTEQGVDPSRVLFESASRNTRENAQFVARLLGARCREPWLLVTSAVHMPRAMAEFQAVGCNVTAAPVDYRTADSTPLTSYSLARSLVRWQDALHEWLGLLVYRLTR